MQRGVIKNLTLIKPIFKIMRTLILSASMLMLCLLLQGQDIKSDSTRFSYCELVGTRKLLSNKVTVEIDFGQATKLLADNRYKDQVTGKTIVFNSMMDALNFMCKNQWEFVQAYIVAETSANSPLNVSHFILKKRTSLIDIGK